MMGERLWPDLDVNRDEAWPFRASYETMTPKPGCVVVQANGGNPESEEGAVADAKASGLALQGDGFIVIRRFSDGRQEGFTPNRMGS